MRNHGWCMIPSMLILCSGSATNILSKRFCSAEAQTGGEQRIRAEFRYVAAGRERCGRQSVRPAVRGQRLCVAER